MKIAGITWWRGNYGSILQAYALQELISIYTDVDYEILDQYGEIVSSRKLLEKIRRLGVKRTLKRIRWKFGSKGLQERNAALQKFISENLHLSEKEYNAQNISASVSSYDGFICGSDQIWNPSLVSFDDIYWLGFVPNNKMKIAYAPSIGISQSDSLMKTKIKSILSGFKSISCREQTGTDLINHIIGSSVCKTVLDPTLVLPIEKWNSILPDSKINPSIKYVFAYILRGDKAQRKLVEHYAKEYNYKIVTFPYLDSDYIEKYDKIFGDIKIYGASPADFIRLISNAEYVFTDSFHCTVFSILYHRPFCIFPKAGKTQNTRLLDIQKRLGVTDRMIKKTELSCIRELEPIDWVSVDAQLENLREESISYLKTSLSNSND